MDIVSEASQRAVEVLRRCLTPYGFKASALSGGYPQVWGRDAPITALGALASGDDALIDGVRASLTSLTTTQTDLGMIHLNVDTRTGQVTTENAGAVDANLWFILGHYAYLTARRDDDFLRAQWPALSKALLWLQYQDMNDCGLLEVPEAGDWADLYSVRYNVLYDNVLFVGALRAMTVMAETLGRSDPSYAARAEMVSERINALMWLDRPWDGEAFGRQLEQLKALRLEWFLLYQNTATLTEAPFYLPWVGFREFGTVFDGFGNMLAILLGVADENRTNLILDHVRAVGADLPFALRAFYPPIYPGDRDWREYFRSRNLNLPHQYHNGGVWPFLGGFYVAALVQAGRRDEAARELEQLAGANREGKHGEWEFNEWIHGLSGRAMGHPYQAWSAGMFLFAKACVDTGQVPLWSGLRET